jgi:hypothetical protein
MCTRADTVVMSKHVTRRNWQLRAHTLPRCVQIDRRARAEVGLYRDEQPMQSTRCARLACESIRGVRASWQRECS